jgi:hypothetical protein
MFYTKSTKYQMDQSTRVFGKFSTNMLNSVSIPRTFRRYKTANCRIIDIKPSSSFLARIGHTDLDFVQRVAKRILQMCTVCARKFGWLLANRLHSNFFLWISERRNENEKAYVDNQVECLDCKEVPPFLTQSQQSFHIAWISASE